MFTPRIQQPDQSVPGPDPGGYCCTPPEEQEEQQDMETAEVCHWLNLSSQQYFDTRTSLLLAHFQAHAPLMMLLSALAAVVAALGFQKWVLLVFAAVSFAYKKPVTNTDVLMFATLLGRLVLQQRNQATLTCGAESCTLTGQKHSGSASQSRR